MERIRYNKITDGSLVSIQKFKHATNGAEYVVVIKTDGAVELQDSVNSNLVSAKTAGGVTLIVAKKTARRLLTQAGIVLDTEKRAPRKIK